MESQVTTLRHHGFVLVTVLIVTAVGLLFGAGALLLFRFQCQQRIDRQHELEKVYAVRSALNWIKTYKKDLPEEGWPLKYYAESGRSLDLLVKPVEQIFPNLTFVSNGVSGIVKHLVMERGALDSDGDSRLLSISRSLFPNQYNARLDYEYGMMSNVWATDDFELQKPDLRMVSKMDESFIANFEMGNKDTDPDYGLDFPCVTNNNVKWWVNVGMPGTGGWLHEEYGRRYYFYLKNLVGSGNTECSSDVFHFCIIRDKHHPEHSEHPGSQHGWPLSENERALVLRIEKNMDPATRTTIQAYLELYEYTYGANPELLVRHTTREMAYLMGIQLAGKNVSLFWFDGSVRANPAEFSLGDFKMSDKTYLYFLEGSEFDAEGRIRSSPDLRAVFEIVASSGVRSPDFAASVGDKGVRGDDFITRFRVAPAYQYDVFLKCPNVTYVNENGDLATVAQLTSKTVQNVGYPIITYDTHGTENKGFRKDEREAERKRNRR